LDIVLDEFPRHLATEDVLVVRVVALAADVLQKKSTPWEMLSVLLSTTTTSLTSATSITKPLSSVKFARTTMLARSTIPQSMTRSLTDWTGKSELGIVPDEFLRLPATKDVLVALAVAVAADVLQKKTWRLSCPVEIAAQEKFGTAADASQNLAKKSKLDIIPDELLRLPATKDVLVALVVVLAADVLQKKTWRLYCPVEIVAQEKFGTDPDALQHLDKN